VPACVLAQLSLNEEHACSTVDLIILTITEERKPVNMNGVKGWG
jgi:hypothetical protein